jgi:signal transduction histidine kinase/ligand-binding sensor domain-containing protein/DNA-binding response OmpR family regulator
LENNAIGFRYVQGLENECDYFPFFAKIVLRAWAYAEKWLILHVSNLQAIKNNLFMKIFALAPLFVASLWAGSVHAIDQTNLNFRCLDVEQGLTSNTVNGLVQDKKGFIWVGTDDGLDRFDGNDIRCYRIGQSVGGGPISNALVIWTIDSDDNIWTSSLYDNYVFSPRIGQFQPFRAITPQGQRVPVDVRAITEDHSRTMWICTARNGIYSYNLSSRHLQHYASGNISCIVVDENNQVWVSTRNVRMPILRLNRQQNVFQPVAVRGAVLKSYLSFMHEGADGYIYAGTWNDGLYRFDKSSATLTQVLPNTPASPQTHLHCLATAADKNLWIGSDDGLLLYNTQNGLCHLYGKAENVAGALSSQFVYQVYQDKEGGLWVGTFYGGVNYAPPFQGRFQTFVHSHQANSVGGNVIAGLCQDAKGLIWVTSDDGGLSCLNPRTGLFKVYTHANSGLSFDNTHALCTVGDEVWVGTYSCGVDVLNTANGRWRHYGSGTSPRTLYDPNSYAIYHDSQGRVWVCNIGGICLYNRATDDFRRMHTTSAGISTVCEDRGKNLWFGAASGPLLRYTPQGRWITYGGATAILPPGTEVNILRLDENGVMWAGTSQGLFRYDERHHRFVSVPFVAPSHNVTCILASNSNLWLTTTNGLVCYSPSTGQSRLYLKRDGLQSCMFSMGAGMVAADGRIYVGTTKGFTAFYPNDMKLNTYVPSVLITSLMLMNKEVPVGPDSPLHQSISATRRIDLSYDDNVITIGFAALSYCIPEKNRFAYYLEGFDKGWTETAGRRSATYTNLAPGTYVFHVRGTNNDGVWNMQGTSLTIVVHPPFYLTWWAQTLYVLLFGLALWLIFRSYKRRTQRQHQVHLQQMEQAKEKELYTAKITFFTMIAHEIRTPVSLIIGPLEKILERNLEGTLRSDMQIIQRNSRRLLGLVNQLLDFRKVQQGMFSMHFVHTDLVPLAQATVERFRPWAAQRGITLALEAPQGTLMADFDVEAVTKIMSNFLTNAIKYGTSHVVLTCTTAGPDATSFSIRVHDDGPGIPRTEVDKIFKPFYQAENNKPGTGIGLTIVRNMVDLHHGTVLVEPCEAGGTTFVATLPLTQQDVGTATSEVEQPPLPSDILPSDPAPKPDGADKPLLLLVDDNEEMLNFLSQSFVDDYTILTATDGRQALDQIAANNFQLIISDWMMPVMDGADLCRAVRANPLSSHIPFVLLTAKTDLDSKIQGMDIGADIFIEKPFSIHYLKSCIRNLIELRSMLLQKFSKMPLVPIRTLASHSEDERILDQLNKVIEENFANPDLDVNLLAQKMNISRSNLYTKIKSISDQTPNELIQLLRLKKAAELLSEKRYRMSEICYMVGFSNPGYFSKCFYKQFGKRPSEFL